MRRTLDLLRHERRAAVFFGVLTQSSLGTGAGYVALLLIANDRFDSPWAISAVLIADLLPAMLLGPLFGALADRWSRRRCMVIAELLRALGFGGIAVVGSFEATLGFSVVAGTGTALFTPAALAALPSLVDDPRHAPAATSLYGAVGDVGYTVGPAAAAGLLLLGGPVTIMAVNAITFVVSALVLAPLRFGSAPAGAPLGAGELPPSLLRQTADGLGAMRGMRAIRVVVLGSSAALFCAGLFNVAELFFATDVLGASDAGFAVLVTGFGLGFIVGSLAGAGGGEGPSLKRGYLNGLLLLGAGLLGAGLAPAFAVALIAFAVAGLGNGLLLVYERLIVQATVPDALMARVFGVKDALASWAFAIAFLLSGALIAAIGSRPVIQVAGALGLVVWAASALALRRSAGDGASAALDGTHAPDHRPAGQHGANLVGGGADNVGAEFPDDVDEGSGDAGVELGPRLRR